ncbi:MULTISPECIES: MFS transporter [unclassified Novosphingobium]|uniref:MFS transporter n=1 Tax=unclassified Novosphingobium TaxID=2644732 RepID=UPI000D30D4A6|nr:MULTISPECIES: MFS transporter [unclassified Novosphingobium]PTR07671.1 AAHS family 4-hydroxybenzoate transporter-like MFS transporter [Novosphingobium sp. GV055]PUB00357.1 AAHS family 4-hydroxybenzoate transporter-like MFS transporter [Novosphingobium sp. GV061]PUB15696.1 AAHS family 4-hydroxybenzoate transporter-like MFS transporter [Novosphingobium sp. GV079]PUB39383.1 AAHS family 4-hydroxybenzoate transporter-like MFS transporter [Novosphingobium sp. GV027]
MALGEAPSSVAGVIDDRPWGWRQKLLLALVSLTILLDGFDNQSLGFALPSLMRDWGLPKAALGSALAAAQVGMLIGAISGGVVGDRFGRKAALVASTTLFGAGTLLIGFVHTPLQLAGLRFAAGLGLGAAFPTVAALAAEFTPARHRSLAVILSIVCVPLGGVVGGMAASAILPVMGWQALFVLAGACTLALALLLMLAVPESVTFLLSNGASPAVVLRSLRRMGLGDAVLPERAAARSQGAAAPLSAVWAPALRADSMLLWAAFFFSLVSVYAAFNWLPTLLAESGLSVAQAAEGLAAFNMGGVVTALLGGALMARFGSRWVMAAMALVAVGAAATLALLANVHLPLAATFALIAIEGGCVNGVQTSLYALASNIYPAPTRARGVGMATGIGRLGAISSALLGAVVVGALGMAGFHWAIAGVMVVVLAAIALIVRHVPSR